MSKTLAIYIFAVGFVFFLIWTDPNGAATAIGEFLTWLGDTFGTIFEKFGDFIDGLSG